MALHVGITGGIGSGKSYVAAIFASFGVPVYYADDRAKWLMQHSEPLQAQIIDLFGPQSYESGQLNRPYLADQIFKDESKRLALNQLVHPAVQDDFLWFAQQNSQHPYVLKEAALLLETGSHVELDRLILVVADKQTKIKRVMQRDGASEDQVLQRMAAQWTDEQKIPFADFIIHNEDHENVDASIRQIHLQLTMEGQP